MSERNGFTLIESLLMMFVISLCMPMITSCIKCLSFLDYSNPSMQRLNQLYQLRSDLLQSSSIRLEGGSLMYLSDQEYQVYLVNEKVIRSPGTVIYFIDVQDCFFYQKQNQIMMVLTQNGKEEEWMIGYVK